jgi:hypothetical protein
MEEKLKTHRSVGLRERSLLLFGRALDTFPGRVPLLVVESRLFGKILEGIEVLQRADKRDEENGSEDGSLAQERVVQVNKTRPARSINEVSERVANHGSATVRLFRLRKVESAHPHVPRDNGGIEEAIFIVHRRVVLQHLAVNNFGIDHSIPVDFALGVLELIKVPVTVDPARVLPRRLGAGEDFTGDGGGAGSLAKSLLTLERTARLKRGSLAARFGGRSRDDASVSFKNVSLSVITSQSFPSASLSHARRRERRK